MGLGAIEQAASAILDLYLKALREQELAIGAELEHQEGHAEWTKGRRAGIITPHPWRQPRLTTAPACAWAPFSPSRRHSFRHFCQHFAPKSTAQFGLGIEPEKTRVMVFGIYAPDYLAKWKRKPETFDFLGFTHCCAKSRTGKRYIGRKPSRKRRERFIKRMRSWLLLNKHLPVRLQQKYLAQALEGYYRYFGLRLCVPSLSAVRQRV